MLTPIYKFYIDGLEVLEPHYKNLTKKYARESGQMFFRATLEGTINLFGIDYQRVKQSSLDVNHTFKVMKYNRESKNYDLYFSSIFSKTDCKFDDDKRMCTLKLTPQDEYTKILDKYDNTYDLVQLAPALSSVDIIKRPLIQVYIAGSSTIAGFIGGEYWEQEVGEVVEYGYNEETEQTEDPLTTKYYFHYHGTFNEFHVYNASNSEINGQYSGTNGAWYNQNDVKIWLEGASIGTVFTGVFIAQYGGKNYVCAVTFQRRIILAGDYIMKNVDDETDTFTLTNTVNYHIYTRLLLDVSSIEGGTPTYDLPIDDFVSDNRNYKKCLPLTNANILMTSRTTESPTKYGKNDFNQYFTDKFVSSVTGIKRVFPVCRSQWANSSIWFAYDLNYEAFENYKMRNHKIKDSYLLHDVIKALLKEIDPTITHEASKEYSEFFYDETNRFFNKKFSLYLIQKSNILKGDYDKPAQKAEITLQDIGNMLRDCFRCYWFIEDGKFKIEHISWFMNGRTYSGKPTVQLDLTSLYSQNNGKEACYASNTFSYDKSDLNARYEFAWMDEATEAFSGQNIDIEAEYVQKNKTENINVNNFSTDIDYMLTYPGAFSPDGFALIAAINSVAPILTLHITVGENENAYEVNPQNALLTWYNLQKLYMHDMPARIIKMAKRIDSLYVIGVKKCMAQEVVFPTENDPDLYRLITTNHGDGQINEMSINLDTRQTTIELVFEPE